MSSDVVAARLAAEETPILTIEGLEKHYPGVRALKGVSLSVRAGTIHGLLGENGAGKSTLVSIVAGLQVPSAGTLRLRGQEMQAADVHRMEEQGVFLVTQEPSIVAAMTAEDNLMLGRWPTRFGFVVDRRRMRAEARRQLMETGIDSATIAGDLSAVDRRKLNILRVLSSGASVIILDEPTTSLTVADRRQLFDFMRRLKNEGVTFIFISHYNEEILEICDSLTVLRDGEVSADVASLEGVSAEQLSLWITGRGVDLYHRVASPVVDGQAWTLTALAVPPDIAVPSLEIRPSEILGFIGLPGSGARETARALFGLFPNAEGRLRRDGRDERLPRDPADALGRQIAYLSDDRRRDGLVDIFSITDNITLSALGRFAFKGVIDARRSAHQADDMSRHLRIKANNVSTRAGTLSGGNQQKVCLGRVLTARPSLLIVEEPARGVDVGAKEEIYRILDQCARSGMRVIVVSSDLDEVLRIVDRICLFAQGRLVADRAASSLTKSEILDVAFQAAAPVGTRHLDIGHTAAASTLGGP